MMDDILVSAVHPVPIKNILFVNSAVLSLDPYINAETVVIAYDSGTTTTTDEMMQRFLSVKTDTVTRIGFAFHYSSSDQILFLNQEPFFTDSDLGEAQDLVFSPNIQFMLDLILRAGGGITHVDFLACDTLQNDKWRLFYQLLQLKTGIMIGASDDNTGNMKYGGDWIMESTQEEVAQIYFNTAIENWAALLVAYTENPSGVVYTSLTATTADVYARNNENLTSYTILSTVIINSTSYAVTIIPDYAFFCNLAYVSRLSSITIPNTITSIGAYSFCGTLITSVNIPESVVTIKGYAFYIITNLTTVTFGFPSALRTIEGYAFNRTGMSYCWLPHGVTTLGASAMMGRTDATIIPTIVLPNTITTLASTSFYGASTGSCGQLFMYTSTDSGATCLYKKYIATMPVGSGSNPNTGGITFNNIITSFDTNSSDTTKWQPVVSSAITAGSVTHITGINYISVGNSFTVTFNTFIPSTTYTITGLTSSLSSAIATLGDGSSTIIFDVPTEELATPRIITISLSDRSVPLSVTIRANVITPITQANIYTAVAAWNTDAVAAAETYGNISLWNVSAVTDMSGLFRGTAVFNADISAWDVSNVTDTSEMFFLATSFNQNISSWKVSNVTNMYAMFYNANVFNQNIGSWNVSKVVNMQAMFQAANVFNGDLMGWNVSKVTNMHSMFNWAYRFNKNIRGWNVGNVTNMTSMFLDSSDFCQNLSDWDVTKIQSAPSGFLLNSATVNSAWFPIWGTNGALNKFHHTFYTMHSMNILTRTTYDNDGAVIETQNISFGETTISNVLSLMDGGGTNPYAIGIVDSDLKKICMDIAYCGVYTKALTQIQQSKLMTHVNTTYKEPHTTVNSSNTYVVTVSGNKYWLAGNNGATAAVANPSLLLTYGKSYIFDQSHSSNAGKTLTINTNIANTNRYTAGVVTNGTPGSLNAYTLIDLSSSVAGATLYYGINGGVTLSGGVFYTSAASSMVLTNVTTAAGNETFSVSFYSSLPAGTPVSYTITNCLAADLGLASLNNLTFTSPYQEIFFTVASISEIKNITLTSGNSVNITLTLPPPRYVMGSISYQLTMTPSPPTNFGANSLNTMAYSIDGVTWTGLGKSIFNWGCFSVAYGNNMWVAGGNGDNHLAYSSDGKNWTGLGRKFSRTDYGDAGSTKLTKDWTIGCMRVKFMNGRFVATGWQSGITGGPSWLFHSTNGIDWYKIVLNSNADAGGSHDIDWNGSGWVCSTYGSLYFIPDLSFNTTDTVQINCTINAGANNMKYTSACVNGKTDNGRGTAVQVYVPSQGVYDSSLAGISTTKFYSTAATPTGYDHPIIAVYGNIAFTTIIYSINSTCYGAFGNTTLYNYSLLLNALTYRTSATGTVYYNVGIVHNMYYDKWTSAWYISSDQGLMKKNTSTYASGTADDFRFTVVVPYNNNYGLIHSCCSTSIGTRLDI